MDKNSTDKHNALTEEFKQLLNKNGEYVTVLHGVSMYPMVRNCLDPVIIKPVTAPLKRYDVVVYERKDSYVVHRILRCRPGYYIIRGDNCQAKEYVSEGAVLGVVTGFWRFDKYVSVTNPVYRAYSVLWVMINPIIRLRLFIIRNIRRAKKLMKRLLAATTN